MMHKTPPIIDFLRPILQWASERAGEFSLPKIAEEMANYFDLSLEARNERAAGEWRVMNHFLPFIVHDCASSFVFCTGCQTGGLTRYSNLFLKPLAFHILAHNPVKP